MAIVNSGNESSSKTRKAWMTKGRTIHVVLALLVLGFYSFIIFQVSHIDSFASIHSLATSSINPESEENDVTYDSYSSFGMLPVGASPKPSGPMAPMKAEAEFVEKKRRNYGGAGDPKHLGGFTE